MVWRVHASGPQHTAGLVPDPGPIAGTSKFLREDSKWVTVSGGGGGGLTEVWSGPSEPVPQDDYLVWIDTDAPDVSGGGGGGDLHFVYTQLSPSTSWSVAHNLGKFPSVEVIDSGSSVIIPDVSYIDANNVAISFASATSGKAYLN